MKQYGQVGLLAGSLGIYLKGTNVYSGSQRMWYIIHKRSGYRMYSLVIQYSKVGLGTIRPIYTMGTVAVAVLCVLMLHMELLGVTDRIAGNGARSEWSLSVFYCL